MDNFKWWIWPHKYMYIPAGTLNCVASGASAHALCHDIGAIFRKLVSHVMLLHPLDRNHTDPPSFRSMVVHCVEECNCEENLVISKEELELDGLQPVAECTLLCSAA